jgi:hypothetical protein
MSKMGAFWIKGILGEVKTRLFYGKIKDGLCGEGALQGKANDV